MCDTTRTHAQSNCTLESGESERATTEPSEISMNARTAPLTRIQMDDLSTAALEEMLHRRKAPHTTGAEARRRETSIRVPQSEFLAPRKNDGIAIDNTNNTR